MFDFLAVPDPDRPAPQISGEARLRALRGVVRHLYRAPGRTEVVVNVIEDLHWLDEGSDVFVGEMVEALEGTPTLAVVNFRPEYEAAWTGSGVYRSIPLVPLGPEAASELFTDLAGDDPSLDGLSELVCERTGGNPFFIEEVVRELAESGLLEGERGGYRLAGPIDETGSRRACSRPWRRGSTACRRRSSACCRSAAVIGKEPRESTLAMVAAMEENALDAALGADPLRLPLRGRDIPRARARLPPPPDPGGRLRLAALRAACGRARRHGSRADRARARAPRRARGPDLPAPWPTAARRWRPPRWAARAAHRAGYSHPEDAMRLWARVTELADGAARVGGDSRPRVSLAAPSARLRLAAGDGEGAPGRADGGGAGDRDADRQPALAPCWCCSARCRPAGPRRRRVDQAPPRAIGLRTARATTLLRVAIRAASSYSTSAPATATRSSGGWTRRTRSPGTTTAWERPRPRLPVRVR